MGDAPVINAHFPNSPGMITLRWEHDFEDVYSFLVQRQGPPYGEDDIRTVLTVNSPTDQFTDSDLQAATSYNHRVCARYEYGWECSEWVMTTTMAPESQSGSGATEPPPPPPPLSTPVLRARGSGIKNVALEWDYSYADNLTRMDLYRDDEFIFNGAIEGNFTSTHGDITPRFNTEYTYKLCFSNPQEQNKCSEPVVAKPDPVAPTAPADVSVFRNIASESAQGGRFYVRPRHTMTISWRNTDIPGQFIIVEALDRFPGDAISRGMLYAGPQERWTEVARVVAKNDPTSLTIDIPLSVISTTTQLTTFRVCAVVPELGDGGKACSAAVTLQ